MGILHLSDHSNRTAVAIFFYFSGCMAPRNTVLSFHFTLTADKHLCEQSSLARVLNVTETFLLYCLMCVLLVYVHHQSSDVLPRGTIQIVTGIEANCESYFPQLREYCTSAEGTPAIFPQLREIRLTIDQ